MFIRSVLASVKGPMKRGSSMMPIAYSWLPKATSAMVACTAFVRLHGRDRIRQPESADRYSCLQYSLDAVNTVRSSNAALQAGECPARGQIEAVWILRTPVRTTRQSSTRICHALLMLRDPAGFGSCMEEAKHVHDHLRLVLRFAKKGLLLLAGWPRQHRMIEVSTAASHLWKL